MVSEQSGGFGLLLAIALVICGGIFVLQNAPRDELHLGKIPWVGRRREWFSSFRGNIRSIRHMYGMAYEGYEKVDLLGAISMPSPLTSEPALEARRSIRRAQSADWTRRPSTSGAASRAFEPSVEGAGHQAAARGVHPLQIYSSRHSNHGQACAHRNHAQAAHETVAKPPRGHCGGARASIRIGVPATARGARKHLGGQIEREDRGKSCLPCTGWRPFMSVLSRRVPLSKCISGLTS